MMSTARKTRMKFDVRIVGKFLSHKENPRNASRCRKAPFRAKTESSSSIRSGLLETDAGKPASMWGRLKVRVSPVSLLYSEDSLRRQTENSPARRVL